MKICIIGAGFVGLTAANELLKQGHEVTVFEKNHFAGGLASGIKSVVDDYPGNWEWDLERFYHHWFANDEDILNLINELSAGDQLIFSRPITACWLNGKAWPLDSPISLLRFTPLPFLDRVRMGLALAYLKYVVRPVKISALEKVTAEEWLRQKMGNKAYQSVWQPLLRGKFKDYYDQIHMGWFWARVYKRTSRLGYFEGGFGGLVNLMVGRITQQGGEVRLGKKIYGIRQFGTGKWEVRAGNQEDLDKFDKVIVTTSPPVLAKLIPNLPADYKSKLVGQIGLAALCLVLALDRPLMDEVYWLNINEKDWPFLAVVEHTNFVDPKHYGGKHIVYVSDYLPANDPRLQMSKKKLAGKFAPFLQKINLGLSADEIAKSARWLFKEPFAQPIVGLNHAQKILPLKTPLPNLYLASMSQVYPWDRGTNYAVWLGRKVAKECLVDVN